MSLIGISPRQNLRRRAVPRLLQASHYDLNAKHLFNAVALLVYTGSGKETETADVRAALEQLKSGRALLRAIVEAASFGLRLQRSVQEQVHTKNG